MELYFLATLVFMHARDYIFELQLCPSLTKTHPLPPQAIVAIPTPSPPLPHYTFLGFLSSLLPSFINPLTALFLIVYFSSLLHLMLRNNLLILFCLVEG